jgi:hypothetical protein
LRALATQLGEPGELASVELRIRPSGRSRRAKSWTFQLTPQGVRVTSGASSRPTLRMVMARDDWWAIARGDTSPIDVFLEGRIRMIGDCSVAERMFHRIADEGVVTV